MAKNHSNLPSAISLKLIRMCNRDEIHTMAIAANEATQEEYSRMELQLCEKYGVKVKS